MYICGIHLSNDRFTEGIVTSSLFTVILATIVTNHKAFKSAEERGGPIKSMPTSLLGKIATPLHGAAMLLPPLVYLIAIPLNGGVQPEFIARWALPKGDLSETVVNFLRISGCIALVAAGRMVAKARDMLTLRQAFHYIGVREGRIISDCNNVMNLGLPC